MNTLPIPRVVIAGTNSVSAKRLLLRAFSRRIEQVAIGCNPLKWARIISIGLPKLHPGRESYNLGFLVSSTGYIANIFASMAGDADLRPILKALWGLYDGGRGYEHCVRLKLL